MAHPEKPPFTKVKDKIRLEHYLPRACRMILQSEIFTSYSTIFKVGFQGNVVISHFACLGYEGAVIKRQPSSAEETVWYPKSPVAFLRFSTTDYARTVMHQFQSFPLDQKVPNYKLRLQFAKVLTHPVETSGQVFHNYD